MSLFDFPRINFWGTIQLNPGTANNDDYAQVARIPQSFGPPYAGQPFGLIDSKLVQARTFGKSDKDFVEWVQKAQNFDPPGSDPIIPAEWNYYGGMDATIDQQVASASVIGVQTAPDKVYATVDPSVPLTSVIGAPVSYTGSITDVNSEGSPPATQFFIDSLTIGNDPNFLLSGPASKGACQALNFYRNINLQFDGGSGGYVYHVMRKKDGASIQLPGFENYDGVICRYYLYRRAGGVSDNAAIQALYAKQQTNPAMLEIIGTFAPLLQSDKIFTGPVGRLMISNITNIPPPPNTKVQNNGPNNFVALAPAVLQRNGNAISGDFSATFPDWFKTMTDNPKYDFGAVTLMVSNSKASAPVGAVAYADTNAGNQRGWVFDFDISSNTAAQQVLQDPEAKFTLQHPQHGIVLAETDYYCVSNQQGIYCEQSNTGDCSSFLNQGTYEPATIAVYRRGRELSAAECPPVTVWQYASVPLQSPGNAQVIATNFKPGQPIQVDARQPGNFLFTFSVEGATDPGVPPTSYNTFMNPPFITNAPSISLRILPNDEDFSGYYEPNISPPVGNKDLTWDVVYQKVLRTYYLLYPVMNQFLRLNCEKTVRGGASTILQVTDPAQWMSTSYMPRTRDMSASRRTLLQAWCRKVLKPHAGGPAA